MRNIIICSRLKRGDYCGWSKTLLDGRVYCHRAVCGCMPPSNTEGKMSDNNGNGYISNRRYGRRKAGSSPLSPVT